MKTESGQLQSNSGFDPELTGIALEIDRESVAFCKKLENEVKDRNIFFVDGLISFASNLTGAMHTRWEAELGGVYYTIKESRARGIESLLRTTQTAFGDSLLYIETFVPLGISEEVGRVLLDVNFRVGNFECLPTPKQLIEFRLAIESVK
jgi:hypothetical protein